MPLTLHGEESGVASSDGTRISLFRFYVSAVSLWVGPTARVERAAELSSIGCFAAGESFSFPRIPAGLHYNTAHFTLGIDSATNAAGAGGGALDATKGMYWAWHSGYINLKLEGTSPRCTTRRNAFNFTLAAFAMEHCAHRRLCCRLAMMQLAVWMQVVSRGLLNMSSWWI
jgi:hypothetical protein